MPRHGAGGPNFFPHRGGYEMQSPRRALPPSEVPHDLEAERAVLNQILMNGRRDLIVAMRILRPEDFFSPAHRTVYEAMQAIGALGANPGDIILLLCWLRAHGLMDVVGGDAGVSSLLG